MSSMKAGIRIIVSIIICRQLSSSLLIFSLSSLLFRNLMETLPSLLTGIRCYFFLFLPKVNKNIRMESFTKPKGYYYYSREPINPYYDNILKPFQCYAFHSFFFFFSFVVFFIMILAGFTALMLHRKNKKNR